jgi:beta-glucosidase
MGGTQLDLKGYTVEIPELKPSADINDGKPLQDFFGLNYYYRNGIALAGFPPTLTMHATPDIHDITDMGWEMYPEGFYLTLKAVAERNPGLDILITENGIADARDRYRASYIRDHLRYLNLAIQDGIPVRSYLYWSLFDNFEWDQGFSIRVGLQGVDYEAASKTRTNRPSFEAYRSIIQSRELN